MKEKYNKGFTLIELLVVITILAVLAVIGMAAFRNVAGNARDVKRKADIDAISKVLENKFNSDTGEYPIALEDNDFASGAVPKQPDGSPYPSPSFNFGNTGFRLCSTLDNGTNYCRQSSQGSFTIPTAAPTPAPTAAPTATPTPAPTATPTPTPLF